MVDPSDLVLPPLVFNFLYYLYILHNNLLQDEYLAKIFSLSVDSLHSYDYFDAVYFSFLPLFPGVLESYSESHCLCQDLEVFPLVFF
jgi:hypothetical protein